MSGHIRVPCDLPPLERVVPGFKGLPERETRTYALLACLRRVARDLRGTRSRPFYSTRAVAGFFGVPQTIAVRVFHELEREGLLVRRRAVGTWLRPLRPQPRVPVRGVVGLPVWQYGYCMITEWRHFYERMEAALRQHQFVANVIFFRSHEPEDPAFGDRLLAHEFDTLLWFKPLLSAVPLMETLVDNGIEAVALSDLHQSLPFPEYRLGWSNALRQGLRAWRRDGIARVVLIGQQDGARACYAVGRLLRELGWPHVSIATGGDFSMEARAAMRAGDQTGVILLDQYAELALGQSEPRQLAEWIRANRVLTPYRLDLPADLLRGARIDLAVMDWARITARIASDLARGELRRLRAPIAIEASWQPRADAAQFAQAF